MWGLTYFHSILLERKRYGNLGWNCRYDFNDMDLETSIVNTKNFLEK